MYMTLMIILGVAFLGVLPIWPCSRKWGSLPSLRLAWCWVAWD